MRAVPTLRLLALLLVPVGFAVASIADRSLLWPMLAADGVVVLLALLDLLLSRGLQVEVSRQCRSVLPLARPSPVQVVVRSRSHRPLAIDIAEDLFPEATTQDLPLRVTLAPQGSAELRYTIVPTQRGAHTIGSHHVRFPSVLQLWFLQRHIPAKTEIKVYPDIHAERAFELLARQNHDVAGLRSTRRIAGQNEFEALREYQLDDEYRSIDWKATARRGKAIVRQFQLEQNQSILFVLDAGRQMTSAPRGELSVFDRCLDASLMLTHIAARAGDHLGLMAFADHVIRLVQPAGGRGTAQRLVRSVYDIYPRLVESNYGEAFAQAATRIRKRTLMILFTQVIDDRAAEELLRGIRSLGRRHLAVCVLMRDPELEALATEPPQDDLAIYTAAAAAELLAWRDRVIRRLEAGGALVVDVDPDAVTPRLIQQYIEIKARHLL